MATGTRWTRGQTYYGYKNHIQVDPELKLIRSQTVTDAPVHDSQTLETLL